MSNIDAVIKVANQLIARVFDQRQFTSGEISYLGRELGGVDGHNLENKFDRLLRINESSCLANDANNSELYSTYESQVSDLSNQIGPLVEQAQRVLDLDEKFRKLTKNCLNRNLEFQDTKEGQSANASATVPTVDSKQTIDDQSESNDIAPPSNKL